MVHPPTISLSFTVMFISYLTEIYTCKIGLFMRHQGTALTTEGTNPSPYSSPSITGQSFCPTFSRKKPSKHKNTPLPSSHLTVSKTLSQPLHPYQPACFYSAPKPQYPSSHSRRPCHSSSTHQHSSPPDSRPTS